MSSPKPGSGTSASLTPGDARPHLREGRDGLQKNLTFALFLQHGFRHSTSTSSEREARSRLLSPKAKGDPDSAARQVRVLGEATRPTRRHVLRDTPHPPACPPAQVSHPELSQNLIPLPPASQPWGGSWQLPSSPLMWADKPTDLHSRRALGLWMPFSKCLSEAQP